MKLLNLFSKKILKSQMEYLLTHHFVWGDETRLKLGRSVSTVNTLFNVSSGLIVVGDNCIFGHNCMVITGKHRFLKGKRIVLSDQEPVVELNKPNSPDRKFSTSELAQYLQYSENYLRKRILKYIPAINISGKIVYSKRFVDKWLSTKETPIIGNDIIIGDGCWIASGVTIIGSVNIGSHSIIGAGSVVTKDIPSHVFAAGAPAKIISELK